MIPDSDALDQLHGHLAEWKRNRAEPTDDDINSVGETQTTVPDGSPDPDLPPEINAQNLAQSLKRGRAAAKGVDVQIGEPTITGRTPNASMDFNAGELGQRGGFDPTDTPGPALAGSSPRSAMLSAVMGAKPPAPPKTPAASAPADDAAATQMQSAKDADARGARINAVGRAVTAMGEQPDALTNFFQQRAGVHPVAQVHSTLWDNKDGEGNAAALVAQRSASERKDPNSATAKTYREVLKRFSPDLNLDTANAEQMEKIASWLESYAKDAATKKKAETDKPDELPSLKANLKLAYPSKAAEIDSLGSAKAAEDFRLINEGRLGRDTSIQAARIAADAARGEARTVRGEVKEDKQTEEAAKQALPGYTHDPKVQISPTEAAAMRDGVAESRSMSRLIDELDGMVAKNGIKVWPDADKVAMQSTMRQLQLKAKGKAFAELGVLSGPDLALLEQLTGDPTDVMSNFKGGAEGVRKRLQVFKGVLNNGVAEKLRSKGYSPEGGAAPAGDGMEHRTLSSGLKAHRKPGGEWEVDDGP